MADKEGVKVAKDYHVDVPFANQEGFYVKGANSLDWGMKKHLSNIFNPKSGNSVMFAFDHGYFMGSTAGLERLDLLERVRLDFSIVNDMRYYNGVIFRGYLPGLASGVLAGGRYDNLLRRMGKTGGAIGFAVYLDQLERLEGDSMYDVDVLLLYDPQDDPAAVAERAQALTAAGHSVRVERAAPQRLRYRELVRFSEGGQM